jgi:hypothetical protein
MQAERKSHRISLLFLNNERRLKMHAFANMGQDFKLGRSQGKSHSTDEAALLYQPNNKKRHNLLYTDPVRNVRTF